MKVWDGPPENEMSLKEVSGSLLPDGIHSTLNVVTIQFETDFYITKSGFAIDFSSEYQHPLFTTIISDVFIISNSIKFLSIWEMIPKI